MVTLTPGWVKVYFPSPAGVSVTFWPSGLVTVISPSLYPSSGWVVMVTLSP